MTWLDRLTPAARAVLEEAGLATEAVAEAVVTGEQPVELPEGAADVLRGAGFPLIDRGGNGARHAVPVSPHEPEVAAVPPGNAAPAPAERTDRRSA